MSFFKELYAFLKKRNKLWLLPLILLMLILGVLMIFASQTVVAPFIYTLF
jgi:cytochrome c-type biogenesis protein CcmH/NrfF